MWQTIISSAALIVVAIIEAIAANERKKDKKLSEQRSKEMYLSLKMVSATLQLSVVSANALTGGYNNGNVEQAKKAAQEAEKEYNDFLKHLAADELI